MRDNTPVLKTLPNEIYKYAIVNLNYKDDSNVHYKFLEKKIWLYKLASELIILKQQENRKTTGIIGMMIFKN